MLFLQPIPPAEHIQDRLEEIQRPDDSCLQPDLKSQDFKSDCTMSCSSLAFGRDPIATAIAVD
jgi:hypothetical protein